MNPAEQIPLPNAEAREAIAPPQFPHFGIPGFEKLPAESQELYLRIPPSALDSARPVIEREIAKVRDGEKVGSAGSSEVAQAANTEQRARPRRDQTDRAIDAFHRAARGDPDAKKELADAKKELLGEEPSDDEIFQTVLEDQSGNLFADDVVLDVMLSDEESEAFQRVLDLFQEFYGERGSVDSVIKPNQQIELFRLLTKGIGTLDDRLFFARQALTVLTDGGHRSLFAGIQALGILDGGEVTENGVKALRRKVTEGKDRAASAA